MSTPIARLSVHLPASNEAAAPAKDPRVEKLRRAAGEFESLLVKQLLKAAKIGGDDKGNGYADMAVDALSSGIEKGGGLGLARRIEEVIGHASGVHKAKPR
jgi:Rod binding domain-containing protein